MPSGEKGNMKKKGRGKAPAVDSRAADANRYSCLSAQEFERLIVTILQEEAFRHVEWHGEKGNDVGRDVICRREWTVGTKTISEKFSVQCKRYASSAFSDVGDGSRKIRISQARCRADCNVVHPEPSHQGVG